MAYCAVVNGAIVRFSGKPPAPCGWCGQYHVVLCDAFVPEKRGTCDAKMCLAHSTKSGKFDFCPNHKHLA